MQQSSFLTHLDAEMPEKVLILVNKVHPHVVDISVMYPRLDLILGCHH